MKKALCYIFLMMIQNITFATPKALVQNINASDADYLSFVELQDEYESYSQHYINNLFKAGINNQVRDMYMQAQDLYFKKNFYKSKVKYLQVIGLYNKYHLNNHSKKIILLSLQKVMELSFKNDVLKGYRSLLEGGAYPNYSKIQNNHIIWTIPERFSSFNKIIINGEVSDIYPGGTLKLPSGKFLITLVSDQFKAQTSTLNSDELKGWTPPLTWMSKESCEFSKRNLSALKNVTYAIYFNNSCVIEPKQQVDKNMIPLKKLLVKNEHNFITQAPVVKTKSWYKNKWVWAGAGVIATAVALSLKKEKTVVKERITHKKGF